MRTKHFNVSIYIIVMALLISAAIVILRVTLIDLLDMSESAANTLMSIGQVVVEAAGAIMIIIQLAREGDIQSDQFNIQEAQFILEYNQSFIQDSNMTFVEQELEKALLSEDDIQIITKENKQLFINYLVYLEGMAPLILNKILQLEHIDDLMAYRFFLAVNNREIQEKELTVFPEYYRGCYRLYDVWKKYRDDRGYEILQEEQSLDRWLGYEEYIDSGFVLRPSSPSDLRDVSAVLYGTDPFIYPAAFGNRKTAERCFPRLMGLEGSVCNYRNIRVAVDSTGMVAGAVWYYGNFVDGSIDYYPVIGRHKDSAKHVCENYFNKMHQYVRDAQEIYIAAVSVSDRFQHRGIGRMLVKRVISDNYNKTIKLDVLCDNKAAIELYERCDFLIEGDAYKGYAYSPVEKPDCYRMIRLPSDRWVMKKDIQSCEFRKESM